MKTMFRFYSTILVFFLTTFGAALRAQNTPVPRFIAVQGELGGADASFSGTGQFKFALVSKATPVTAYWKNDNSALYSTGQTPVVEPVQSMSLPVVSGAYGVFLGYGNAANNASVYYGTFTHPDLRVRTWFRSGTTGAFTQQPDVDIPAVGYAMQIPDNTITSAKIAAGAVTSTQIASGAVVAGKLGTNAVSAANIAPSAINFSNLQTPASPSSGQVLGFNGTNLAWTSLPSGIWSLNGIGYPYYNGGGFVGIGTNSPAAQLHIVNSSGNMLRLDGSIPHINFIDTGSSNTLTGIGAKAGSFYVSNNSVGTMMQLTAAGYMGLGTTAIPASPLHISGTTDAIRLTATHPDITFEDGPYSSRIQGNSAGLDLKSNGAIVGSNPGGIIHLDGVGSVGIGTTTPTHQLTIVSNSGTPSWTSNGWLGAIALDNASAIAWQTNSAGQRFGMGHTNGSFCIFRTASNPGTTGNPATYDMVVTDVGNVGIGTTGPGAKLQVVSGGDIGTPQALLTQTTSADYARLRFTATGSPTAWDIAAGSSGGVMNFYATSTGKNVMSLNPNGTASVQVLTITGGADLAEPFKMKEEKLEKGSVVVIDGEHPGRLMRSSSAYDTRVAGIVSGANGVNPGISLHQEGVMDGEQNVALSGRVYVQADTSGGPIRPGDLLTTSDTPGHAMKVTDHAKAQGAIIGKAMGSLDKGEGMVLVLVSLQ